MADKSFLYNKQPLGASEDREEYFLIEVPGIIVPECDFIYYGLLEGEHSEEFVKLRERTMFNQRDIYNEHVYFQATDLIAYLLSPDDTLESCDADFLEEMYVSALNTYKYNPTNETMIRHALIEAAMYDFVKKVCLVYPWGARPIDQVFMSRILPEKVRGKVMHFSGNLMDAIKNRPSDIPFFTTIVTNSIEDAHDMIDNASVYKTDQAFILLRNHSGNTEMKSVPDPEDPSKTIITFDEVGTPDIINKLMTPRGFPKGKIRFARFVPYLYSDRKPNGDLFNNGL